MQDILFEYSLNATTWTYLSSLMTIGIYFKFRRFWSVRNLDLVLLIAFAPGLLLVTFGLEMTWWTDLERFGYQWLFVIGGLFFVRLLVDPIPIRRPLLEPNLSAEGLTFTGVALLIFLMANVVTTQTSESDLAGARRLEQQLSRQAAKADTARTDTAKTDDGNATPRDTEWHGPGYPLFYIVGNLSQGAMAPEDETQPEKSRQAAIHVAAAQTTAILAHLGVVIGMVLIGYRHFANIHTGVAVAALYLLLPYTTQMTGRIDHAIPAALLVWAVAAYRRPLVAGVLIALAAGVIPYPLFLFPLWCGFYWRRGLFRFLVGGLCTLALLISTLALTSTGSEPFLDQLMLMFGWPSLSLNVTAGFWKYYPWAFRIPVLAAFVALSVSLALWPTRKNLGTLLSHSAAVMLAAQYCDVQFSGLCMAWYLPLLLLTIFRPNLDDRIALATVGDFRLWRRGRAG